MYKTVPFQPEHATLLVAQDEQLAEAMLMDKITPVEWAAVAAKGPTISAFRDSELLCCCGLSPVWPGRAEAWMVMTNAVDPAGLTFIHRQALEVLDEWQLDDTFHRLEATAKLGFRQAHRWLGMLKFVQEGVMKDYFNGQDYALYARVK